MTPRPGLGVAAVGPITPDGGGLFLTRCTRRRGSRLYGCCGSRNRLANAAFGATQKRFKRLPELDTALYDEDVLSDEVPDACVGGCREQKLGGTREFIYGCVLLRNRYLPLLSCALTLEGP